MLARAQYLFQLRAQPLDLLGADVLRARAKGAVNGLDGLRQRRMRRRGGGGFCRGVVAAQLELQPPALRVVGDVDAVDFERAHLGQRGADLHRRLARTAAAARRYDRGDRRQAHEVARRQVDQFAWLVDGVSDGRHQVELHRMPDPQRKGTVAEAHFMAFLGALGQQADALPARRTVVEDKEVATRRTATDARRLAAAGPCIGDRAARYGNVGIGVVQHVQRRTAPCAQGLGDAACQCIRAEHATIEQQGVGHGQGISLHGRRFQGHAGLRGMLRQEARDVPRHSGIGRVWQAELDDGAPRAAGPFRGCDLGKEAVDNELLDFLPCHFNRSRATDQL
ncbi:hypothetical protein D9M68_554660 [compost metagenome]